MSGEERPELRAGQTHRTRDLARWERNPALSTRQKLEEPQTEHAMRSTSA